MDRGVEELPANPVVQTPADDYGWLRSLARSSPVAIFRADAEGECTFVNARWCELAGLPPGAALGSGWESAIHPEDRARVRDEWGRTAAEGVPFRSEYRFLQPSGTSVWLLGEVVEERDASGRLMGYVGTATDISELRRMREELQRSHAELEDRVRERTAELERMAMIVAGSDDAIMSCDLQGTIVSWNQAAESIFAYAAEEIIGKTTALITPADCLDEARAMRERVKAGETVNRVETVRVAQSGELIEVSLTAFPLRDSQGEIIGTSGIMRDIRERKKAERRLHRLSWRLLRTQDEERRRVARELHDSTAQGLAALAMNLSLLSQPGVALDGERRAVLLADSVELAAGAVRDLRSQAYLLHPPLLDERGLNAALRWFVQGFSERSGIAVTIEIDADFPRLHEQLEMSIFRVIQESLSNVLRHARSATASIRVALLDGWVTLEIRDAGCGLASDVGEGTGLGIAGMRERLLQLGGTLTIAPNDPGTVVIARLPEVL